MNVNLSFVQFPSYKIIEYIVIHIFTTLFKANILTRIIIIFRIFCPIEWQPETIRKWMIDEQTRDDILGVGTRAKHATLQKVCSFNFTSIKDTWPVAFIFNCLVSISSFRVYYFTTFWQWGKWVLSKIIHRISAAFIDEGNHGNYKVVKTTSLMVEWC